MRLKVLSPIHIGSGKHYSSLDFIFKDNRLLFYNFDDVMRAISERVEPDRLKNYVEEKSELTLSDIFKDFNISQNEIKPQRVIKLNQKSSNNLLKIQEIEEFINFNGKYYIPGSEIKGAIRTAVLFYLLKKQHQ